MRTSFDSLAMVLIHDTFLCFGCHLWRIHCPNFSLNSSAEPDTYPNTWYPAGYPVDPDIRYSLARNAQNFARLRSSGTKHWALKFILHLKYTNQKSVSSHIWSRNSKNNIIIKNDSRSNTSINVQSQSNITLQFCKLSMLCTMSKLFSPAAHKLVFEKQWTFCFVFPIMLRFHMKTLLRHPTPSSPRRFSNPEICGCAVVANSFKF